MSYSLSTRVSRIRKAHRAAQTCHFASRSDGGVVHVYQRQAREKYARDSKRKGRTEVAVDNVGIDDPHIQHPQHLRIRG